MILTEEEIRHAMQHIEAERAINNQLFCEWLTMSHLCPHCAPFARKYQKLVRAHDMDITTWNEPLCE